MTTPTPTLSTGDPSTLGVWLKLSRFYFGPASPAVAFLKAKVAEQGSDEVVLADEHQFLQVLFALHDSQDVD